MQLTAQINFEVYVNSRGTNAIKKYDAYGTYLGDFISPSSGGLFGPEDMLFRPDGTILISGFGNNAIKKYDAETGAFLGDFTTGYALSLPSKMNIGPDSLLYVTQWDSIQNKIARFTLDGTFVDEFTTMGLANGLDILFDSDGNLYVAVFGNGENGFIQKLDPYGNDLGPFINSAILDGPTSMWREDNGDFLVEDWSQGNIYRFDSLGDFVSTFSLGFMSNPEGVAFTPDGNILIGDWGQDAVHLLDPNGSYLGYFTTGDGLMDPNAILVRVIETTVGVEQEQIYAAIQTVPNFGSGPFNIFINPPKISKCKIVITNTSGRVLLKLHDGILEPGPQTISWTPDASFANGSYLIQVESEFGKYSDKISLVR